MTSDKRGRQRRRRTIDDVVGIFSGRSSEKSRRRLRATSLPRRTGGRSAPPEDIDTRAKEFQAVTKSIAHPNLKSPVHLAYIKAALGDAARISRAGTELIPGIIAAVDEGARKGGKPPFSVTKMVDDTVTCMLDRTGAMYAATAKEIIGAIVTRVRQQSDEIDNNREIAEAKSAYLEEAARVDRETADARAALIEESVRADHRAAEARAALIEERARADREAADTRAAQQEAALHTAIIAREAAEARIVAIEEKFNHYTQTVTRKRRRGGGRTSGSDSNTSISSEKNQRPKRPRAPPPVDDTAKKQEKGGVRDAVGDAVEGSANESLEKSFEGGSDEGSDEDSDEGLSLIHISEPTRH